MDPVPQQGRHAVSSAIKTASGDRGVFKVLGILGDEGQPPHWYAVTFPLLREKGAIGLKAQWREHGPWRHEVAGLLPTRPLRPAPLRQSPPAPICFHSITIVIFQKHSWSHHSPPRPRSLHFCCVPGTVLGLVTPRRGDLVSALRELATREGVFCLGHLISSGAPFLTVWGPPPR